MIIKSCVRALCRFFNQSSKSNNQVDIHYTDIHYTGYYIDIRYSLYIKPFARGLYLTTHFVIDIKSISVNKNYFKNRENVYTCVVLLCVNFFILIVEVFSALSLSLVKFSNRRRQL